MNIPLRNKIGEVIAYTTVSPEHFEHLNQFKWSKNRNYVTGTINKKGWMLHRYIKILVMGEHIPEGYVVDHIDNNPLNNHHLNLRIVSPSENSRNRKNKENCTSNFRGVSKINEDKFNVHIRINNKQISALYNNEIHAAHQYNLWIDEYKLTTTTKNNIEIPQDFIQHVSRNTLKELPKGIVYNGNKTRFVAFIQIDNEQKRLGTFDTLEEAIVVRQNAEKEKSIILKERLLAIPKTFNKKGQCIFKIKDTEVIIDEDLFYDIIQFSWTLKDGYARGKPNGKITSLSRYIMNYTGKLFVDHINNNRLDNRKDNLRLVTQQQNNMNVSSREGSTSQYVGVYFRKDTKKWCSQITVKDDRTITIGCFINEIDAAKARDVATREYYGIYGKLNFPEDYL